MRPYLAIIKDSFREALASWILWGLLLMITMVLLVVAPLGYREEATVGLRDRAIRDVWGFMRHVRSEAKEKPDSPSAQIWGNLDEDLRGDLEKIGTPADIEGDVSAAFKIEAQLNKFRRALNDQLKQREFYDEKVWRAGRSGSQELRNLLRDHRKEDEQMDDTAIQRMNRLLMENAYPSFIAASSQTSVRFRYFTMNMGPPLPLRRAVFTNSLQEWVRYLMSWGLGGIGIFVAILVTAPIIPQTFEPGSLHLLLSKPISRSRLFLAKFVGGCAFILVCTAYLIAGLWVILGLQFGIWEWRFLLVIPIYLFVFAIYYSVSSLFGMVYRNAIIAIAVTIMFWGSCWLVGTSKVTFEERYLNRNRVNKIVPAGDELMAVSETGLVNRWNAEERSWDAVFDSKDQRQIRPAMYILPTIPTQLIPVGPIYDPGKKRLLSIQQALNTGKTVVYSGTQEEDWEAAGGANAPTGAVTIFLGPDDTPVVVANSGIFRLVGSTKVEGESPKVFGMDVPLHRVPFLSGMLASPFQAAGPLPPPVLSRPYSVANDRSTGQLVLYSRGTLTRLKLNAEKKYERLAEEQLEGVENDEPLLVAAAGKTLVTAREDGHLELRDIESLAVRKRIAVESDSQPRFAYASPSGNWVAVLFHNGRLWMVDTRSDEVQPASVWGQGNISAATFTDDDQLMVADRATRIMQYDLKTGAVSQRYSPKLSVFESTYYYVIVPLYTVFPKPGELDKTVTYLLTGQSSRASGNALSIGDLSAAQTKLRPWAPVWSSLAFVLAILGLACVYIEWKEF